MKRVGISVHFCASKVGSIEETDIPSKDIQYDEADIRNSCIFRSQHAKNVVLASKKTEIISVTNANYSFYV
jgi:hypothetical protein